MTEFDPHPPFQDYAVPTRLVSAPWLSARLGTSRLRVIEVDEDALLYDIGHIPTATRINFREELMASDSRDIVDGEAFAQLMSEKGIRRDDTIVLYGDKANWWAAYALWVFELFGHPDVRLLDGGREAWMSEERDTSFAVPEYPTSKYPVIERDDSAHRVFVSELCDSAKGVVGDYVVIDTRAQEEFNGQPTETSAHGDSPYGTTIRHGHIPGAKNLDWNRAIYPSGNFRPVKDLREAYADIDGTGEVVLYSHVGAQAAHSWFVLKFLLGHERVRNYDGSWAEWGNMIRMPVER